MIMINVYKIISISILSAILLACSKNANVNEQKAVRTPIPVIFDTDMGNDIDDALALDMLYKYQDEGRINLLGIMLNKDYRYAPEYVDIMNTWYGYPDIPIGILKKEEKLNTVDMNFTTRVSLMKENGIPKYERTITNYDSLPAASALYRKLLANQPDSSVVIISVGFSTNLAALLNTSADSYSPLSGKELVAQKVKLLSAMGGSFNKEDYVEYNILMDIPSAREAFAQWPTEVVFSPFELGEKILYPGASIENDFNWTNTHPLVDGYRSFSAMPYDRPTWDLTSVLYVLEPDSSFFNKSSKGFVSIDEKGISRLIENEQGKHVYLTTDSIQDVTILSYFVKKITTKPLYNLRF